MLTDSRRDSLGMYKLVFRVTAIGMRKAVGLAIRLSSRSECLRIRASKEWRGTENQIDEKYQCQQGPPRAHFL